MGWSKFKSHASGKKKIAVERKITASASSTAPKPDEPSRLNKSKIDGIVITVFQVKKCCWE